MSKKEPTQRELKAMIRQKAHDAKVKANEDEVIDAAKALDPNDTSKQAQYIRDVADDIQMRRGGLDLPDTN